MALDLRGRVIQVLPMQTGTSARGEWKKQEFILETEEQYPRKVCISLWGDKIESLTENETITVSINVESREYQGRWYTEVRAWRVQRGQAAAASQGVSNVTPASPVNSDDEFINVGDSSFDDLPF